MLNAFSMMFWGDEAMCCQTKLYVTTVIAKTVIGLWMVAITPFGAVGADILRSMHPAEGFSHTVAVMDFSVPAEQVAILGWAKGGMADLLQVELERRGVVTLDRSVIQTVLAERGLVASGVTDSDLRSLGTLLGAKYLVSGKVSVLSNGQSRVEASVFSVETITTLAAGMTEGVLSKDLPAVLNKVADDLAAGLLKGQLPVVPARPVGHVPLPEALIAYYNGLNAFANGQHELGAGWFLYSSGIDKEFLAPQLWEINAYKVMGLNDHVRIRLAETEPLARKAGVFRGGVTNRVQVAGRKTVVVLPPMMQTLAPPAFAVGTSAFVTTVKRAVVAEQGVSLFEPEHIDVAVNEQDRVLNPLFSRGNDRVKYGNWASTDALLMSRLLPLTNGQAHVRLMLCNPLTSVRVAEVSGSLEIGDWESRLSKLVEKLVKGWLGNETGIVVGATGKTETGPVSGAGPGWNAIPEPVRQASSALGLIRMAPKGAGGHHAWAEVLYGAGRHRQCACEIEQAIRTMDITTSNAVAVISRLNNWIASVNSCLIVHALAVIDPLESHSYTRVWSGYFPTLSLVDPKVLRLPSVVMFEHFKDAPETALLRINLARDDWMAENWEQVCQHAAAARGALISYFNGRPVTDGKVMVELGNAECNVPNKRVYRVDRGATISVIGSLYYMQAASLARLGRFDEAERIRGEGDCFVAKEKAVVPQCASLQLHNYDPCGLNRGAPVYDVMGWHYGGVVIKAEDLAKIKCQVLGGTGPTSAVERANWICAGMRTGPRATIGDYNVQDAYNVGEVSKVIAMYEGMTNHQEHVEAIQECAMRALGTCFGARPGCHMDALQAPLSRFVTAMLRVEGVPGFKGAEEWPEDRIKALAFKVIQAYEVSGFPEEWGKAVAPLLEPPYAPSLSVALLSRGKLQSKEYLVRCRRLAQRFPGGERDMPYALWMRAARMCQSELNYAEAFNCFRSGFRSGAPAKHYVSLALTLNAIALDRKSGSLEDAVKCVAREVGAPDYEPFWLEWWEIGRQNHNSKRYMKAAKAYQYMLELKAKAKDREIVYCRGMPPRLEPRYTYEEQSTPWGSELVLVESKDWHEVCAREDVLVTSATFYRAECMVESGMGAEAAPILRKIAKEYGTKPIPVEVRTFYKQACSMMTRAIGVDAAKMLAKLHLSEADMGHR